MQVMCAADMRGAADLNHIIEPQNRKVHQAGTLEGAAGQAWHVVQSLYTISPTQSNGAPPAEKLCCCKIWHYMPTFPPQEQTHEQYF